MRPHERDRVALQRARKAALREHLERRPSPRPWPVTLEALDRFEEALDRWQWELLRQWEALGK